MRNPIYSIYGLILLAGFSLAQWMGVSVTPINEMRNVPRSVRENPGVYRSHYSWFPHWFGGK